MPKKRPAPSVPSASPPVKRGAGNRQLVKAIAGVSTRLVTRVASVANQALVLRNWIVGACIRDYEQNGSDRARYGERLLPALAMDLTAKGVKGCSREMLRRMRSFGCGPGIMWQ